MKLSTIRGYFTCFVILISLTAIHCSNVSSTEEDDKVEIIELDHDLLNSFYEKYGGRNTFPIQQRFALESFILAYEDVLEGRLEEANIKVDSVFKVIPFSNRRWEANSSNSHCRGCPINVGSPTVYYGMRMLDQITTLGLPESSETLTMTAVVAPCAAVTRPTQPDLTPETVQLTIDSKILADNAERLHSSTALFRTWVQSITGGLTTNLIVYTLEECTTVDYSVFDTFITSYPDANSMIESVPFEIAQNTDFWWVIAPSGVPEDGSGFDQVFITGGMGSYGAGLPLFLSDDAWFTRKPVHLGVGEYHEVELLAYQPQWFQHEFMHHLYRTWSQFNLEETGHQWFDRSNWPDDFIGSWEPDYYAESLTKRLLNATPSLADGLQATELVQLDLSNPSILVGKYERIPVQNGWHEVNITFNGESLTWTNLAGASWSLSIVEGEVWAGPECPYGEQKLSLTSDNSGTLTSLYFNGELYTKVQ